MCGIAGGFWSQLPNNLESRINNAILKMKSRGPDDSGVEFFNEKFSCVALAQTRLSIIDLSSLPHQWFLILSSTLVVFLLGYAIPKLTLPFLVGLALKFSSILLIFIFFIFVGLVKLSEIRQVKASFKNYLQRINIKA